MPIFFTIPAPLCGGFFWHDCGDSGWMPTAAHPGKRVGQGRGLDFKLRRFAKGAIIEAQAGPVVL